MKNEISQTRKINRIGSILTIGLGIVLLIYMITVEGEPGALPLFLIAIGTVWFFINRYQIKKQYRK